MKIFARVTVLVVLLVNLYIGIWSAWNAMPMTSYVGFSVVTMIVFTSWKMGIWTRNAHPWTRRKDYTE